MPSNLTVSQRWAEFIGDTSFANLPAAVVEQTKSRILDSLATAIAARGLPVPSVALKFVQSGAGKATIIGHHQRVPALDAAFVNGTLVNGTTHDDFVAKSHAGAVVIPAALAVAEEEASSGKDLLASVVVGYEITARTYMGGPTMLPYFRATGVAGTIGAAAAAGQLQQLSTAELVNALGLSALVAAGFGEGFMTGTMDVKLNVGWASRSGVSAATLARCGATASPTAFEGKSGFYAALSRSTAKVDEATRDLGERYLIEDVLYKERPVCFFVQTPVQLAYQFAQQHRIDPGKIERVTILAPEATYTNPGYQNVAPYSTPLQARISASFCTAAALLGKPIHEYGFYGNIAEPEVLALAEKIHLLDPTEDKERVYLEVVYDGGKIYHADGVEVDTMRPTTEKIVAKFKRITGDFLGSRAGDVMDIILNLESLTDIRELTELLRPEESGHADRQQPELAART